MSRKINVAESAAIAFAFAHAVGMPAMIPCRAKQPLVKGYDAFSTAPQTVGELRHWLKWSARPGGPNAWAAYSGPGVKAGNLDRAGQRPAPRLVVLDIDTRDAAIADHLLSIYGRSPLTVRTPGRGTHHYFCEPEGVGVDSHCLPQLSHDVKGRKSLCHLPGSLHPNGGRYQAFFEGEPLETADLLGAPCGFLLDALPVFDVRAYMEVTAACNIANRVLRDNGTEVTLDDDTARHRGGAWLAYRPGAVANNGGDNHTYLTACNLKDIGVPKHIALELMETWNLETCLPPWPDYDLRRLVNSAFTYGRTCVGSRAIVLGGGDDESGAPDEEDAA